MKRTLLLLPLLCGAASSFAQTPLRTAIAGPWVGVNTSNVATVPNLGIVQMVTLTPTFTWGLAMDASRATAYPPRNISVRAVNAAGTEFDYRPILGTSNYQPTNLSVPNGVPGNATGFCGQYATGAPNIGSGEIIRTRNGGVSWQRITNATHFAAPEGFCNWVYAFDANNLVAGGDPNPLPASGPGQFEILYSSNANAPQPSAVTWTRAVAPVPLRAYPNRQ